MLPTQHQTVRDRQENAVDARIATKLFIKAIDSLCRGILGIDDAAMLEHVVKDQQAIGSDVRQEELVIKVIAGFVSIDEGKIELGAGGKRLQLCLSTPKAQVYFRVHAGKLPVSARDGGPLFIDIDTQEASASEKATGDADGAITGEGADFHGGAHPEDRCQKRQERALFATDEHPADRAEFLGLGTQIIEDRIRSSASMRANVRTKLIIERNVF